ncbi:hypothetical protein SAMN02927930_00563 [Pseudidiomarina indica]|uniref:Uncharacterized protein n=1 Tax=Pseudidiomarina indica TaxID=1159017 RepID=A0A1G6AZT3_9GAMM|nr:hypothetical protein [Pseudidiomarina indica]SDB13888.1 hypothetical protein SAMN02927930_00563 [Pseudidiomarina indica]
MTRYFFLLPLILSLLWYFYLRSNGWTIKQGVKGFIYIAILSAFIAAFYTLMLWLTGR